MSIDLNFDVFCDQLKSGLEQPLPGYRAQQLMEPPERQALLRAKQSNPPREGAVLILFFPGDQGISTIMIERAVYDGVHSGQIAFPGGRRDPGDHSLTDTALRETAEEVGIIVPSENVLGTLTPLFIPPSNFNVLPVVAYVNHSPQCVIQPEEVKEAFHLPISSLLNPENTKLVSIKSRTYQVADVPAYCVGGKVIWGATAMIISEVLQLIRTMRND
ncbi:MAG TPA: CoA pyrophosphatase [Bacteroidales bacterium]|nr:CoA pyrophosphatase [Bacteroidales bacterium]